VKIRFKLYATLGRYLPDGTVGNVIEIDVPEDASPNSVIDRFRVPRQLTHLVLVNGVYAPRKSRDLPSLKEGDALAVWPPIAGG